MKTFYITGDRAINPIVAAGMVGKALAQLTFENDGEAVRYITGNSGSGVEAAVQFIAPKGALSVTERSLTPEGYTDWDASHKELAQMVDGAIVLHGDPLGSRIGKSVTENFPEDKVRFIMQELGDA